VEDDYRTRERAEYPRSVLAAGVFWIVLGSLIVLNAAANVALSLAVGVVNQGNQAAGACPAVCSSLFGIAFLFVGVQSVKGTARDTLGNGIGSIGIGVLNLGFGGIMIALALSGPAQPQAALVAWIAGGVSIFAGLGLVGAGVLALVGRTGYRVWREENYPSTVRAERRGRRRRPGRRPRPYDDDDDDRFD
jgi:hypothetical protein